MAVLKRIKPPPIEALPLIIAQFAGSTDAGNRDLLARAIQEYGQLALPYLVTIKQLYNEEADPTVKQNLQRAIKVVEEPPTSTVLETSPAPTIIDELARSVASAPITPDTSITPPITPTAPVQGGPFKETSNVRWTIVLIGLLIVGILSLVVWKARFRR